MNVPFGGYTPKRGHKSSDERDGGQPEQGNYLLKYSRAFLEATDVDKQKSGAATPKEVAYAASKLRQRGPLAMAALLLFNPIRCLKRFRR